MSHEGSVWSRSRHVAFVDDGERVVVVSLARQETVRPRLLVGSAALIWRAIDRPCSAEDIFSAVSSQLDDAVEGLNDDTLCFVEVLVDEGLLVRTRKPTASPA